MFNVVTNTFEQHSHATCSNVALCRSSRLAKQFAGLAYRRNECLRTHIPTRFELEWENEIKKWEHHGNRECVISMNTNAIADTGGKTRRQRRHVACIAQVVASPHKQI